MLLESFPHCKRFSFFIFFLTMPYIAMAQRIVSGSLVDENKKPVSEVTIAVKGTSRQTFNDVHGKFSIEGNNDDVLVISHVSFQTLEVRASEAGTISLISNAKNLSEVVVTALGVKKELKRIGYSVQEVKGDELVKARDQNPVTGLTGKVAGYLLVLRRNCCESQLCSCAEMKLTFTSWMEFRSLILHSRKSKKSFVE
jgi:hypothetical protein